MQHHQTSLRSPWRVVITELWLFGCLFVVVGIAAACGTADDFADDLAATEAEGGDSLVVVDAENPVDDSAAATGSRLPAGRPVLEVTSQATLSPSGSSDRESGAAAVGDDANATNEEAGQATPTSAAVAGGPETTNQPALVEASPATTAAASAAESTTQLDSAETTAPTTPPTTVPPPAETPSTPPETAAPTTAAPRPPSGAEPNCNVSCNIAMEGDSLTVGLGNRLCQAVQTGNCINSGIVGRRVDEMIVTARTDVDNQVGSEKNDVLILWGGTNDLWQKFHSPDPATNASAIYEQIKVFVAERRAAGWDRVYVMTLPPMNPTYVIGTEPLNDLIRQNGAGADGVIDVGADSRLANAFDPAMRAADGIHFGDGGRAVVMEHILGTIGQLDGA